jgi:hypothetical protein
MICIKLAIEKPRQPKLTGFGLAQAQQLMMDYCVSLFPAGVA